MASNHVLRVNSVEEETAYLKAVSEVIGLILAERNPDGSQRTQIDIAEAIDCESKTIGNAFNKRHSLSEPYLRRLGQAYGADKLDPWARLSGARMTPIEADEAADALPTTTAAIHKLAVARSPTSPGGEIITHSELLAMEGEIDAAIRALTHLKCRAEKVRAA